ncbi:MAG: BamA/TamA family outer membrane protein [Planctomycetaceae bacterium]
MRALSWCCALLTLALLVSSGLQGEPMPDPLQPVSVDVDEEEELAAVRIEGNKTIASNEIAKHIKSRPGRPVTQKQIRDDVDALHRTRWFAIVTPAIRKTDEGKELVFKVIERPIVHSVTYQGAKTPNAWEKTASSWGLMKTEEEKLAALTGLKKGAPYDISGNRDCARRIEKMYHEKGYAFATVELVKGDNPTDRDVVFEIDKGPKVKVTSIKFEGNNAFNDQLLALKLRSKKRIAWVFGGKWDPSTVPDDKQALAEYYRSLGYFDISIKDEIAFSQDKAQVHLKYTIEEGPRYKIRNLLIDGNDVLADGELRSMMAVKSGDMFNARTLSKDVEKLQDRYGEMGRFFARVDAVPVYLEEPGVIDLQYRIDEATVTRIRSINVHLQGDHPHTKHTLVRNISRIHPGDLADPKKLKLTQSRLGGSQYFETQQSQPGQGIRLEVSRVTDPWIKIEDLDTQQVAARGQSDAVAPPAAKPGRAVVQAQAQTKSGKRYFQESGVATETSVDDEPGRAIIPTQGRGPLPDPQRYLNDDSPQGNPLMPGIRDPGPTDDDWLMLPPPAPPADFIDVDAYLTEARTGRLMFGVGVNSNAGLIGNIVFSENNFNILRPPTSWADVWSGSAWRGAGQKFRIEALPGTQVSRYMVDWQDPYFLDSDYNLGVSGFYYNRYFRYWTEQRMGGRVRVGRQFTQQWSGALALRLEDVDLFNPAVPTPQILSESVGANFLSTVRGSLIHDTRDAAFMPGSGHYVEAGVEQAFAEYNYTRYDVEGRQYFTTYERPDGGGRHTIMLRGEMGYTGSGTPIFENYFAGGYQSFRGFMFRGVTPVEQGVGVGGRFMALGTLEYLLPVTANEMIKVVGFSDFGTVDSTVSLDDFRVSVGAGLRLTVPMMGPVPIALDFAVPIMKQNTDLQQVFSFYIGANW